MPAARFRQDWVDAMLAVATAMEELGPIRAGFSIEHGFVLDGRYGVPPAAILRAADERQARRRVRAVPGGGRQPR